MGLDWIGAKSSRPDPPSPGGDDLQIQGTVRIETTKKDLRGLIARINADQGTPVNDLSTSMTRSRRRGPAKTIDHLTNLPGQLLSNRWVHVQLVAQFSVMFLQNLLG